MTAPLYREPEEWITDHSALMRRVAARLPLMHRAYTARHKCDHDEFRYGVLRRVGTIGWRIDAVVPAGSDMWFVVEGGPTPTFITDQFEVHEVAQTVLESFWNLGVAGTVRARLAPSIYTRDQGSSW